MVTIFSNKKNLFFLATLLFAASCLAGNKDVGPFTPLFKGLDKARYNNKSECVSVSKYSTQIIENDMDQTLKIFKQPSCVKTKLIFQKTVPVEVRFGGFWSHYAVLDEGTDANSHDVHIINIDNPKKVMTVSCVLEPEFKNGTLYYLFPTDKPARPDQCKSTPKSDLAEWARMEFGIEFAGHAQLDIKTGKVKKLGHLQCYPLQ